MAKESTLPLHIQKAITGRILTFPALYRYEADFNECKALYIWDGIHGKLMARTRQAIEDEEADQSLEDFMLHLAAHLEHGLDRPLRAKQTVNSMMDDLNARIDSFTKEPIDPLIRTFQRVLDATIDLYRKCGITIDDPMIDAVNFAPSFTITKDTRSYPSPYLLNAWTEFGEGSSSSSTVHLQLVQAESFDWKTNLAIPYALFHECICHVLQGPLDRKRFSPGGCSGFADGWMDLIAYQVHDAVMEGRIRDDFLNDFRDYAYSCRNSALEFHNARYIRQVSDRSWSRRTMGKTAAVELFAGIFRRLPRETSDPKIPFWCLSMNLNTSDIQHGERELFAESIRQAMRWETRRARTTRLLRQYVVDRDIHQLVHEVIELPNQP